jgi:hypothetical protein
MSEEARLCPECGEGQLIEVGDEGRYLECSSPCGYRFDTFLSREAERLLEKGRKHGKVDFDAAIRSKAETWLKDPALLAYLEDAVCAPGSEKPLMGESDNAIQLLLILIGKGSVEVRGRTGAGKNALVDHVLRIFPRDSWVKVGGLTDKSLRYLAQAVKILYVVERRGIASGQKGEESTAEYDIKVGISEGEISVATTERDADTGEFRTTLKRTSIESFVFTSTEVEAPPELENRLSVLNVRDDMEQNRVVRDAQLSGVRTFSWEKPSFAEKQKVAACVVAEVLAKAPSDVVIPYAEVLKPILSVESSVVRRNTPRILDLIKSCARLHFKQREIVKGPEGKQGIVSSPDDLALVLYTGERSLSAVLSAMPEKVALVHEICKSLSSSTTNSITTESIMLNAKPEAKAKLGSRRTIRRAVSTLAERGVLIELDRKEGKHKVYSLEGGFDPLTMDIASLLREANSPPACAIPSMTVVREQTEQEFAAIDGKDTYPMAGPSAAANLDSDDSRPRGQQKAGRAHLVYPPCSVCSVPLGTGNEPTIYTRGREHFCKAHFLVKPESKEGSG